MREGEKAWLWLDRKDPANWELTDVERYLAEGKTLSHKAHTPGTKNTYLISCRAVAPKVKAVENATAPFKKAARKAYPIIKSSVFLAEYKEIIGSGTLDPLESIVFRAHVVLGAREGTVNPRASILGLQWEDYDARTERMQVFESKVVGWWKNIPLDALDPDFPKAFLAYWESQGKPNTGKMFPIDYGGLKALYRKIRNTFDFLKGKKFTPHFARKTHVNILWEEGYDMAVIAGDAGAGEGYVGVGWTDLATLQIYYLSLAKSKLDEYRAKAKDYFRAV